jgi:hypothetical protein
MRNSPAQDWHQPIAHDTIVEGGDLLPASDDAIDRPKGGPIVRGCLGTHPAQS